MLRSTRAQSLSLTTLAGTFVLFVFCCSLATIREGFFFFFFFNFYHDQFLSKFAPLRQVALLGPRLFSSYFDRIGNILKSRCGQK